MNKSFSKVYHFLKQLQAHILPDHCCICSQQACSGIALCALCESNFPFCEDRCFRCGECLDTELDSVICQRCVMRPPKFDRLFAVFSYEFPINILLPRLKFHEKLYLAKVLRSFLREEIEHRWYQNALPPQAIIPVPLHPTRLQQRGFNQSYELVRNLNRDLLPVLKTSVVRQKKTKPQSRLNFLQRSRNLTDAFKIIRPIEYDYVAIVDDVVTTGATVNALATTLKQAGVQTVDVWCIAKA